MSIHDYGQIDGQLFLDMALVNGVDLGELLREERRLDPDRAVRLIGQVARALGVAHRAGLVAPTTAVNTTPLPQPTGIPGVTCRAA